jgi:hypothetical protein
VFDDRLIIYISIRLFFGPAFGQKKTFPKEGKVHPRKKGNNDAMPTAAAADFFNLCAATRFSILSFPLIHIVSNILA